MTEPMRIGPVFAFTDQRDAVARFYRDIVGIPVQKGAEDPQSAWFAADNAPLAVHDRRDPQTPEPVTKGQGFVIWFGVPNLQETFKRVYAAGAVVGTPSEDFFYGRDPDGRYIGFFRSEEAHGHSHDR
jgi:predicted enzyme related to lactoylglutathione lyase